MMVEVVSRKSLTLAALANPEGWWGKSGRERQGGGRVWSLFSIGAQRPNDERNTDNYERKPATAELKFGSRLLYRRGHEVSGQLDQADGLTYRQVDGGETPGIYTLTTLPADKVRL